MSAAQARPELAGVKIRKRKKDIKAKYEPEEFRDQLVQELKPVANENAETVGKHLDSLSEKLDYKTYGETLFDVLFTGGMLDAGGEYKDGESELCPFSVFSAEETPASVKRYAEVFNLLIRRYRYLQTAFEESIKKLLRFLGRYTPSDCNKLAMCVSFVTASQLAPMSVLSTLFMDHLVKEGLSLQFMTTLLRTYLSENSLEHLTANLKKNGLEDKLLDFFPPNKRTAEFFARHFSVENLDELRRIHHPLQLVKYHNRKALIKVKDEMRDAIVEMIQGDSSPAAVNVFVKQQMAKNDLNDVETVDVVWDALMKSVEWPRKVEQCEEQAIKQVKEWGRILTAASTSPRAEIALLNKVQVYCYEDTRVSKIFAKLVTLLYQLEALSENAVVYWQSHGSSAKGKAGFVKQLEPFVLWLQQAEEESDSEEQRPQPVPQTPAQPQ